MNQTFLQYFRCPERYVRFGVKEGLSENSGFFQFGQGVVGYGRYAQHRPADSPRDALRDAWQDVNCASGSVCLPFDLQEVVENLRMERYTEDRQYGSSRNGIVARMYYAVRPVLPVAFRRHLQRAYLSDWNKIAFPNWPVDHTVDSILRGSMQLLLRTQQLEKVPFIWFWPDGLSCCTIMTHDVEDEEGRAFCDSLMDIDDSFGVKSSFQVVPEQRYSVTPEFVARICNRGFEMNLHDLNHDGQLFRDRNTFLSRARKINYYAKEFGAIGFRSGAMYRQPEWLKALEVSYDMSVPNVAHMEPQRGGCCTVMPYFIEGILELPLTATQDWALHNVLRQQSSELWKQEIDLISAQHGLISFIVHPDYTLTPQAQQAYRELLAHIAELRSTKKAWVPLPREVNEWWRQRAHMQMVQRRGQWVIEGAGKERARIAYARLVEGRLVYSFQPPFDPPAERTTETEVAIRSGV